MFYQSTRGKVKGLKFCDTLLEGLAEDGGLIVPEEIPQLSDQEIESLSKLSYQELAFRIFTYFVDDIDPADLKKLVYKSYTIFRHQEITPIVKVGDIYILELFHGPTFAFKDIALQFVGNLFAYLLQKKGIKVNILGATSGDTGSAAIYGIRGKPNVALFMLHPYKKVSTIQEWMMTSVLDENIHNLAIQGTFDDCQAIVKALFMDLEFKRTYHLTAVNSISWARLMPQMVYYFYAYFRLSEKEGIKTVRFSVPTGNFGDIFAGYLARRMLGKSRIERLILATNENDILARFVNEGDYSVGEVKPTISPSMDIQVASNFERYLFYLFNENGELTSELMERFSQTKALRFTPEEIKKVQKDFLARRVTEKEILDCIAHFYQKYAYLLDPHTAVGVKAGLDFKDDQPIICLATAHPAKFPETVEKAIGKPISLPPEIEKLRDLPKRLEILAPDIKKIKKFISERAIF